MLSEGPGGRPPRGLGGAARTALGHRRRRGARGGVHQSQNVILDCRKDKQRHPKSEKTQKTKIRRKFYNVVSLFAHKVEMILWSIRTFWYKCSAKNEKITRSNKRLCFSNITTQAQRLIFPQQVKKIYEIDISQIRCKCYTRYKSDPIYISVGK